MVKNLPNNTGDIGDAGLISESGGSPGEGNDNALQYPCLDNPMDRGAWRATVHRVAELDMTERLTEHADLCPLFPITHFPSVGKKKPLSGDDTGPAFKMESDLVTLKIWPPLECKMKCRSFTAHQTASAFIQKKMLQSVQASVSEILQL